MHVLLITQSNMCKSKKYAYILYLSSSKYNSKQFARTVPLIEYVSLKVKEVRTYSTSHRVCITQSSTHILYLSSNMYNSKQYRRTLTSPLIEYVQLKPVRTYSASHRVCSLHLTQSSTLTTCST